MARRVNIFGQPLSYDVGVEYVDRKPVDRSRPINPDGDDISTATKETVLKYVEDLTHGVEGNRGNENAFPVSGNSSLVTFQSSDGTTPPLSIASNQAGQYVEPFTKTSQILESYSNSSQTALTDGEPALQTPGDASFIKKGKSKSGQVDGHKLLSDNNANLSPEIEKRYVSPILTNNRFSPSKIMTSIVGRDKKFNPEHPSQGFGSYKRYSKLGTDMTDGQLANVGPMLTLRATKELDSISSTGYGQDGPDGAGAKAASLLPGLSQIGVAKVSTDDLQVESVLRALIEGETEAVNVAENENGPRKVISMTTSYGQMNNVLEQFSGLLPLGMVAAGAALAIALNVAIRAVLAVFLLITNASNSTSQKRDEIGRYLPGDSRFNPAFQKTTFPPVPLPAKLFGLVETVNPYGDAVNEGIKVFFGGNIGGSLQRVIESPGFYVALSRNIVRSAADLARILEDVGRGNPIQIAENIISFVEAIKSSKVVAVMNMFAQIGDVALSQAARLQKYEAQENRDGDSEIDNIEGLNAMRNRKPSSLALAWGAATTKSILLLPTSTGKAMLAGRPNTFTSMLSNTSDTQMQLTDSNRLSAEVVASIESELNAEYMPFYFHDLRTNEIVSFQAFLVNLGESYSPNWDSVDGYGRIDAIKMYRSTARKLELAFFVAATNHDDFNAMWVKINKLVTLVYPQWSKGTLLRDGDGNHFTQPFSQIPTASPLMRVRVGDLWKSNYSKFNLARIFGLGSDDTFKLKEFTHTSDVPKIEDSIQGALFKIKNNNMELPLDTVWLLEPGDYDATINDQGALGAAGAALASVVNSVGVKTPSNARVTARIRVYARVVIMKAISKYAYAVKLLDDDDMPDVYKNATFIVSRSHLSITDETLVTMGVKEKALIDDPINQNQRAEKIVNLSQFFTADNNALVKAFESAKGRGLACVVESLNFDWMDGGNIQWETGEVGSRAPKMCKVSMSLSVVHDIAPGLDANGFNRAPVYTVGAASNAMAGNTPADEGEDINTVLKKVRKSLL
jgi:hypothetical protein